MKKTLSKSMSGAKMVLLVMAVALVSALFAGCGFSETTYEAATDFYYSDDRGHSYGNGTKEYAVGDTVYMKVICSLILINSIQQNWARCG